MSRTTGFTIEDYRVLLAATAQVYPCVGFEVLDGDTLPARFAIVRHDIDMSPGRALELARVEYLLGVRATYTVLLTGDFYSPLEENSRETLRQIAGLGHDIGLHFDARWHGIDSEEQLEAAITWEAETLDRVLGLGADQRVAMFSFHNTTPFTMSCRRKNYAGLHNAYAGVLQQGVQYTSDSNGYWIHRSWRRLLDERHDRIQVLTHPEWWETDDHEPAEKVCHELQRRASRNWSAYVGLLAASGRVNRTGLGDAARLLPQVLGAEGERLLTLWLEGRRGEAYVSLFRHLDLRVSSVATGYRELKSRRDMIVFNYSELVVADLAADFDRLCRAVVKLSDPSGTWT